MTKTEQRWVRYHSREWDGLVEQGWVTKHLRWVGDRATESPYDALMIRETVTR